MSYHRSGHPGAVAVSYGASTMAPLSPSRRYSSTNSTTTTSGIGSPTTNTKFNSFRSPMSTLERNYTSTTPSSYRFPPRRIQCSPSRSVSSYSDTSSVVSLSTNSIPKYSSTGNSSASSTVSSASSTRERTTTPTSKLTLDELYQKYSVINYVPNKHNRETTPVNGHCRGSYTPLSAELYGGDERDSIHSDRWSTRQAKRRSTPLSSGLPGRDDVDYSKSQHEVTKNQQCNERSDINPSINESDSNANNNHGEFNVNCNDVKFDDNQKQEISSSSSSLLLSTNDSGWCGSESAVADTKNLTATNNRAWKDTNDEGNVLVTNNNAQECCKRLNEVDTREGRRSQWTANGIEGVGEGANGAQEEAVNSCGRSGENGFRVTGRPAGSHGEDSSKPSTSRRNNIFGWNDGLGEEVGGGSGAGNGGPVGVHQAVYRGLADSIEESSTKPARSRITGRRDEGYGLNGLRNIGNTCFMNSVIQCLSNTRPLLEYLRNEQYLNDINTTTSSMKGALIKSFAQVIYELWEDSGERVVNTTALKSQIQRFAPRFMGYAQQDAQEFLRYLLEGLHEDVNRVTIKPTPILTDIPDHYSDSLKATESWKRYLRSEDSTIVDVFVGQLRSSLTCTSCDHVSVTLDPFWDLSLPIPARTGTVKLNQCLEHFTKAEVMDGDEKPTCSKCQMRRKCTKSFAIQKFPKILVIHLKRFSPTERFRAKLSVLVDFPLTGLDLSAFAAPDVQGCTYNLYGVANHSGTPYSGHYTAYCKHPYSGEWHEYNDSRISPVSVSSVISSEAYVLFYEQQQPNPHL
ncbi:ubiquitin carboxyl-terminal hydrolase 15 [Diachasma alloeum]|uniref:ubiquitin carboxyl-terminal hydrolase 15 n=1 Tax=Diachasma alloeum TaxID=454923 RepID=UPI0007382B2C|nr:ubiquitin carboxyl-terminal hydrolase 15 [Diachasma alloeum]XP_015108843.1 ubiquitin carboxyl-terminal hydrolase 15 [Diachasma alloeum]XP_015108844.1 ubiquitin carboxyl-terminal hydrolase 15 [Diachasma alloeum]XP_015108845.1 ubiquitin carboxyl-terminal hydrolase 15 [Diachasma alloeum]XP_015108846.1 ubiquitin carboxyl-terminal hydrolase 15 [Diachasma alloeum]